MMSEEIQNSESLETVLDDSEVCKDTKFPIKLNLRIPVPIYRSRLTNVVYAFSSKILYITGELKDGYYPVASGVPGYGRVNGFAKQSHIGNILLK